MLDLTENYRISRNLAAQGMVLLKNEDHVLPLKNTDRVGIIGKECLDLLKGGGGSGRVNCAYVKSLLDGLNEKSDAGKIALCNKSVLLAEEDRDMDISLLNELALEMDKAIVTYKRFGTEGDDRHVEDFYPSNSELELLQKIEQSEIKEVVLILNIASVVDLSFIERFSKIKAVLLTYFAGMECGTAIADVLCGDVNPSGKLVDTVAYNYKDYPTAEYYNSAPRVSEYKEGIFVGYRYFETYAKDKVLYPFGFGLSYTEFHYSNYSYQANDEAITVSVDVTNVGEVAGREVVQVYCSAPEGMLKKPAVELKGFAKTREIQPGEKETVTICFPIRDMSSFDDSGATGYCGAWVLERGDYEIFVGKSVRDLYSCGKYFVEETKVTKQLTLRFDGSEYCYHSEMFSDKQYEASENLSLYDVSEGKMELHEFVNQLTSEELVSMSLGQPLAFPQGTSGLGNLRKYQVPNPQTADGPAGIRRSVNTTCFPCATLIACSWDYELQYAMGKAMGFEGYSTGLDVILAPAMNIHRDPLGGRNFEYFSEDPLVSGKTAAALVKGIQSEGLCATIKHFAANSCEYNRCINNSVVEERVLREIYLKGFEIAIKESNPAFVMSSYNLLNGKHTSANIQLLRGILRDEWGYEGAVMTDWRNGVPLSEEIIAGNNIKMPFGYPDEGEKALRAYENGEIALEMLRENAFYVLKAVMKTRSFVQRDFGIVHKLDADYLEIPAMEVNGLASSRINHEKREDGVEYLYRLNREQRNQRSFVYYVIDVAEAGEFVVNAEISTNCSETQIWYYDEQGNRIGTAFCDIAKDEEQWYIVGTKILLHKGENVLKLVFANEPYKDYEFFNPGAEIPNVWPEVAKEDIRLAKLTLSRCK